MERRTHAISEGRSRKPVVSWAPVTKLLARRGRISRSFVQQILEQKRDCSQSIPHGVLYALEQNLWNLHKILHIRQDILDEELL